MHGEPEEKSPFSMSPEKTESAGEAMCTPDLSREASASTAADKASPLSSRCTDSTEHVPLRACHSERVREVPHHREPFSVPEPCSPTRSPTQRGVLLTGPSEQHFTPSGSPVGSGPSMHCTPSGNPVGRSAAPHEPFSSITGPMYANERCWDTSQSSTPQDEQGLCVEHGGVPLGIAIASSSGTSGGSASVSNPRGSEGSGANGSPSGKRTPTHTRFQNFDSASGSGAGENNEVIGQSDDGSTASGYSDSSPIASVRDVSGDVGASLSVAVPRFVEVVVEVPRGSFVKWRAEEIRHGYPTKWTVDYVGFLPCPFNYGSVPAFEALDGDPQDALVLGPRIPRGCTASIRVEALLKFVDAGIVDHKLVCKQGAAQTRTQTTGSPSSLPRPRQSAPWGGNSGWGIATLKPLFPWDWGASEKERRKGTGGEQGEDGSEGCHECSPACPGRLGTGISLPVARRRSTVRCAICSGSMPFPRPLAASNRAGGQCQKEIRASFFQGLPTTGSVLPTDGRVSREGGRDQALVKLDLSLPQFLMITAFFRMYAACKGILNNMRGHDGTTTFCGWEVAGDSL